MQPRLLPSMTTVVVMVATILALSLIGGQVQAQIDCPHLQSGLERWYVTYCMTLDELMVVTLRGMWHIRRSVWGASLGAGTVVNIPSTKKILYDLATSPIFGGINVYGTLVFEDTKVFRFVLCISKHTVLESQHDHGWLIYRILRYRVNT
jgi:hypothetical protein